MDESATSPRIRARKRAHRCYELSFLGQTQAPEWELVHGTVQCAGFPVLHAWLELDGMVYDAVEDWFLALADYYRDRGAVVQTRFTLVEAATICLQNGVYGPWVIGAVRVGQVLVWCARNELVRIVEVDSSTAKVELIDSGEVATVALSDCRVVAA